MTSTGRLNNISNSSPPILVKNNPSRSRRTRHDNNIMNQQSQQSLYTKVAECIISISLPNEKIINDNGNEISTNLSSSTSSSILPVDRFCSLMYLWNKHYRHPTILLQKISLTEANTMLSQTTAVTNEIENINNYDNNNNPDTVSPSIPSTTSTSIPVSSSPQTIVPTDAVRINPEEIAYMRYNNETEELTITNSSTFLTIVLGTPTNIILQNHTYWKWRKLARRIVLDFARYLEDLHSNTDSDKEISNEDPCIRQPLVIATGKVKLPEEHDFTSITADITKFNSNSNRTEKSQSVPKIVKSNNSNNNGDIHVHTNTTNTITPASHIIELSNRTQAIRLSPPGSGKKSYGKHSYYNSSFVSEPGSINNNSRIIPNNYNNNNQAINNIPNNNYYSYPNANISNPNYTDNGGNLPNTTASPITANYYTTNIGMENNDGTRNTMNPASNLSTVSTPNSSNTVYPYNPSYYVPYPSSSGYYVPSYNYVDNTANSYPTNPTSTATPVTVIHQPNPSTVWLNSDGTWTTTNSMGNNTKAFINVIPPTGTNAPIYQPSPVTIRNDHPGGPMMINPPSSVYSATSVPSNNTSEVPYMNVSPSNKNTFYYVNQ